MQKSRKARNNSILIFSYVLFFLFVGMIGYLVYFVQFDSEEFTQSAYNPRLIDESDYVIRGDILSADGEQLATTNVADDGTETRVYSYSNIFSHVVGYSTNGMSGLEQTENDVLLTSHAAVTEQVKNSIEEEKSPGDNVVTTLNTVYQKAVYNALGSNQGAFVAMSPDTGEIYTLVSKPDFDPNTLSDDWASIVADDSGSSVLVNRALSGKYAPGSTFKIVTALEYLREGGTLDDSFYCSGSMEADNYTIHCFNNNAHGTQTLKQAFGNSCNVAFSEIGLSLDIDQFQDTASELLFNTDLPDPFGTASNSSFTLSTSDADSTIMVTSFGQGKTLVTPYHMMLIASTIANDGVLMEPYVVDHVENHEGITVSSHDIKSYGTYLTEEEASELQEMMRYVVTNGTGKALNTDSYDVYGKTGTAEYNNAGDSHSWFVGYAEQDGKRVAFACIVEGTDDNTDPKSIPVVKSFLDTFFNY